MDSVGGYRVIRRLGGGASSEVLLAHDAEERTVVLRLLDAAVDEEAAVGAIEALSAIDHPAVLPLVDFASIGDRVLLVHPRVAGGTLGELLASRHRLLPAEAAGIVAAVTGGVTALHAAGWAHGRITARSVLLSLTGESVLAGFGALAPLDAGRLLADLEATRELALEILPSGSTFAAAVAGLPADPMLGARMLEVVGSVPHAPVDLTRPTSSAIDLASDFDTSLLPEGEPLAARPSWIADLLTPSGPVLELVDRAWSALKQVRRPFWFGAVGVAAALIVAAVLIPDGDAPAEASADGVGDALTVLGEDAGEGSSTSPAPDPTASGAGSTTAASGAPGDAGEPVDAGDADAIASDDPLAAVQALLAQRQRCLAAASEQCLVAITQDGAPARADALAALQGIQDGGVAPGPIPFSAEAPFVQRTGGSAIVTGGTVSVLIVDSEEGWRLRDVFDAPSG